MDEDIKAKAMEAARYLREEADFNRSWTDGRRGSPPPSPRSGYATRRIELAEERESWALAIERLAAAGKEG